MKQYEAVISTLERLGGMATLMTLNREVMKEKEAKWGTKTPFASIRRIVQEHPAIFRVRPGLWALESFRKDLEAQGILHGMTQQKPSLEEEIFTHSYYQGLIVEIGNLRNFQTYVPPQDKNKKFITTPLKDLSSVGEMPPFSYQKIVRRSSTVDVVWLSEWTSDHLLLPSVFFEVEHSTDIQNSLLKFCDLQAFNARMVIVADKRRKTEFEEKISYKAIADALAKSNVVFWSYDDVAKVHASFLRKIELPSFLR